MRGFYKGVKRGKLAALFQPAAFSAEAGFPPPVRKESGSDPFKRRDTRFPSHTMEPTAACHRSPAKAPRASASPSPPASRRGRSRGPEPFLRSRDQPRWVGREEVTQETWCIRGRFVPCPTGHPWNQPESPWVKDRRTSFIRRGRGPNLVEVRFIPGGYQQSAHSLSTGPEIPIRPP